MQHSNAFIVSMLWHGENYLQQENYLEKSNERESESQKKNENYCNDIVLVAVRNKFVK